MSRRTAAVQHALRADRLNQIRLLLRLGFALRSGKRLPCTMILCRPSLDAIANVSCGFDISCVTAKRSEQFVRGNHHKPIFCD
jgi:hypothetical protein